MIIDVSRPVMLELSRVAVVADEQAVFAQWATFRSPLLLS
jgi:hypothetical protein